jgi:hypothetical protein
MDATETTTTGAAAWPPAGWVINQEAARMLGVSEHDLPVRAP